MRIASNSKSGFESFRRAQLSRHNHNTHTVKRKSPSKLGHTLTHILEVELNDEVGGRPASDFGLSSTSSSRQLCDLFWFHFVKSVPRGAPFANIFVG